METSIYTQLEISGKTEEIMKAISVIMNHQYKTGRAKYYFADGTITVNNSRMKLQAELISEYLKNTEGTIQGAITIEMDGPYGEFYSLREIDFFEKIADLARIEIAIAAHKLIDAVAAILVECEGAGLFAIEAVIRALGLKHVDIHGYIGAIICRDGA